MINQIVAMLKPTETKQYVYIFSTDNETTPVCVECNLEELLSVLAMSAAKYKIKDIKLTGAHDFAIGIKEQLVAKINTCFGSLDGFNIQLLEKEKKETK